MSAAAAAAAEAADGITCVEVTDGVYAAPQPTKDELGRLRDQLHIASVLNMRDASEPGFVEDEAALLGSEVVYELRGFLTADDIAGVSHTRSLPHPHVHFYKQILICIFTHTASDARSLVDWIRQAPRPTFVHCNVGLTAALATLLFCAVETGADARQVMQWGMQLGFNFANTPRVHAMLTEVLRHDDA